MKKENKIAFILLALFFEVSLIVQSHADRTYEEDVEWLAEEERADSFVKAHQGEEVMQFKEETPVKIQEYKKREAAMKVTATFYNPVVSQCDDDPLTTADMSKINTKKLASYKIRWIAISQDLKKYYDFGDVVEIKSKEYPKLNGYWVVHDVMNARYRKRIDVLLPFGKDELAFNTHELTIRKVS